MFSAIIKKRALKDRLDEDALTSLVFDTFKYLPPKYLKKFLEQATNLDKEKLGDVVPIPEETPEFYFWEFYPREFLKSYLPEENLETIGTEPDLIMLWSNLVIVEESKWGSRKSGEDKMEEDKLNIQKENEQDLKDFSDQLARELIIAKALSKNHREYFLLYVTNHLVLPEEEIKQTINSIKRFIKDEKEIRRRIFWTNWRNAVVILQEIFNNKEETEIFKKMAKDLFEALEKLDIYFPFQGFGFLEKLDKDDFPSEKLLKAKKIFYSYTKFSGFDFLMKMPLPAEELLKSPFIFYSSYYWEFLKKIESVSSSLAEQEKIFYQGGKNG